MKGNFISEEKKQLSEKEENEITQPENRKVY